MSHQARQDTFSRQTTGGVDDYRQVGLSGAARRTLQNRLSQRRCRERKKQPLDKSSDKSNLKWIIYSERKLGVLQVQTNNECLENIPFEEDLPASLGMVQSHLKTSGDGVLHFCRLGPSERNAVVARLRAESIGGAASHLLNLDLLLSVKQYNIFTAMSTNAASIGLSMESLRHDIPSPFNTSLPWSLNLNLPPSLRPTELQKQKAHHPWIDLFPIASVRDALLKHEGKFDDEELCHDLFGSCVKDEGDVGIFIWGGGLGPSCL
ncbi:hypothetical protein N7509_004008 [Penicillium cosmopolitanum]|uniref:BZIP domain-containing protein n=1 Tax=Penicillium cosmopolitanum TaxID=1131564 RepID=A0A9W9W673_9EURO|nr:uncharacterized protein N7509_004008 [Penicillium cosmopolitanum]KAJ5404137.1 hypothetical protein N7509_004008 [Penicillium cosmopolitanum]